MLAASCAEANLKAARAKVHPNERQRLSGSRGGRRLGPDNDVVLHYPCFALPDMPDVPVKASPQRRLAGTARSIFLG